VQYFVEICGFVIAERAQEFADVRKMFACPPLINAVYSGPLTPHLSSERVPTAVLDRTPPIGATHSHNIMKD
jgi:hypothetical protein